MNVPYQIPGRAPDEGRNQNVSQYWRERFTEEPYYAEGDRYEDYEAAYLAGHDARVRDMARAYDQVEAELHRDWDANRGSSSLAGARPAMQCGAHGKALQSLSAAMTTPRTQNATVEVAFRFNAYQLVQCQSSAGGTARLVDPAGPSIASRVFFCTATAPNRLSAYAIA